MEFKIGQKVQMDNKIGIHFYITNITGDYITISTKENGLNGIKTHKSNLTTDDVEIEIGMKATFYMYSDQKPFEIVGHTKTKKTIEVREMKATIDKDFKMDWVEGGFAGHLTNNDDQKWIIESDENAPVEKARLTSKGWKFRGSYLSVGKANKFHDYNF
jgi:hypothetical protein